MIIKNIVTKVKNFYINLQTAGKCPVWFTQRISGSHVRVTSRGKCFTISTSSQSLHILSQADSLAWNQFMKCKQLLLLLNNTIQSDEIV